jgi:hypothetical protein
VGDVNLGRNMLAAGLVALLVGCGGSDSSSGGEPADSSPPESSAAEQTGEPPIEPTEAETPQSPEGKKPAFENARLPAGGQASFTADGLGCADVAWGAGELPAGVTITLRRFELEPEGIVVFDQAGCGSQVPACGPGSTIGGGSGCHLGVRKVGDGTVTVHVIGDCKPDAACEGLQIGPDAPSQLFFDTTTVPSSETPPTDEPTETPSG